MSWGTTISGDPKTVLAEFQKFNAQQQNSTNPPHEKEIVAKLATDVMPMLCEQLSAPVMLEANGSEGDWNDGLGIRRSLTLKFTYIIGWKNPETQAVSSS